MSTPATSSLRGGPLAAGQVWTLCALSLALDPAASDAYSSPKAGLEATSLGTPKRRLSSLRSCSSPALWGILSSGFGPRMVPQSESRLGWAMRQLYTKPEGKAECETSPERAQCGEPLMRRLEMCVCIHVF